MRKKPVNKKPMIKKLEVQAGKGPRHFDYKDPEALKKLVTERGRIIPRSRSGLSAREQRELARAVKRARVLALLPFAQ